MQSRTPYYWQIGFFRRWEIDAALQTRLAVCHQSNCKPGSGTCWGQLGGNSQPQKKQCHDKHIENMPCIYLVSTQGNLQPQQDIHKENIPCIIQAVCTRLCQQKDFCGQYKRRGHINICNIPCTLCLISHEWFPQCCDRNLKKSFFTEQPLCDHWIVSLEKWGDAFYGGRDCIAMQPPLMVQPAKPSFCRVFYLGQISGVQPTKPCHLFVKSAP